MNSNLWAETLAVFQKEWRTEMRSRHGLFTSFLFSLLAVVAMSIASFGQKPPPNLAAGMICVTLLFSAVIALPRSFLVEDEQGTFDLIRLAADPLALFQGKLLYNALQGLVSALVLAVMFLALTNVPLVHGLMFWVGLSMFVLGVCAGVSVCGAFVIGATNRWLLGTVAALPVLLPQVFLGIGALRAALGAGFVAGGWQCVAGLAGWALVLGSGGPYLAAAAWKTDR